MKSKTTIQVKIELVKSIAATALLVKAIAELINAL